MKSKHSFSLLISIFHNYHFFTLLSIIIFLYSLSDVAKAYLTQNTKTIKPNDKYSYRDNNNNYSFCDISDDIQFNRFILLALDGVSFHYIQPILDYFGKNVQLYTTINNNIRYTQSIFRTWLTGRDSVSLQPFPIEEDNVMLSYNRTYGISLYVVANPNYYKQGTVKPLELLFSGRDIFYNTQDVDKLRPFEKWLKDKDKINNIFNIIEKNNYSILSYEDATDHVQHWQGYRTKCRELFLAENIPYKIVEDIQPIKEFIDKHNDYILIISSDHGHDEVFYENNTKTVKLPHLESFTPEINYVYYDHGGYIVNNTGWWLYYSPLLSPSHRFMNITDCASTWIKYIKNVDIPANSVGRPMNSMRYIRNEIKVKQQGLYQLWNLCRRTTKYCKGDGYKEGLEWREGEIKEMERERNEKKEIIIKKEKKDIKEKELELVKNMISMNANKVFPYNLSVNELIRIKEGRDKNPRRKEKQNITTHYYYEYDMDENGNLYDNLKEKNEKLNISKEEAKEIIDKYNLFINESEILHNLLYDTCIVIKNSDYKRMGNNIKLIHSVVFYFSYIIDILLFCLIMKDYLNRYNNNKNNDEKIDIMKIKINIKYIYYLIFYFFIISYIRLFYISFSRMKIFMDYVSQEEVSVGYFRNYDPFPHIYSKVNYYIISCCIIIIIIILIRLIILYNKWKMNNNNNNLISTSKLNSFNNNIKNIYNFLFHSSLSSQLYSHYLNPLFIIIITIIFLPIIYPHISIRSVLKGNIKKYQKMVVNYTDYTRNIYNKLLYLSLFDINLFILKFIINYIKKEKNGGEENKRKEGKKKENERNNYLDLFDRICLVIISYNFSLFFFLLLLFLFLFNLFFYLAKWMNRNNKKWYFDGYNVNMMIIVLFIILLIISEMVKKRRKINIIKFNSPSIFNFISEFKSSWSIINSIRSCGANSSYNLIFLISLSLFLCDRPIKMKVIKYLYYLLIYILLPLLNILIKRIYLLINNKDNEGDNNNNNNNIFNKKYEQDDEDMILEESSYSSCSCDNSKYKLNNNNNKKNKNKNKNNSNKIFSFLFDCFEIFMYFITLHLIVELISFIFYCCLYFAVDRAWIGIEGMEYSYFFSLIYMVSIKAGYPSLLFLCSSYLKDVGKYLKNNNNNKNKNKNEEINENNSSAILNENEENKKNNRRNFISNFFTTHISLLFIPLPLSFLLQVIYLYLLSYVGTTADAQKQLHYLIYCLVQGISSLFAILPLVF